MAVIVKDWTYEQLVKKLEDEPCSQLDAGVILKLIRGHEEEMAKKYGLKEVTNSFDCDHNFVEIPKKGTQCTKCEVWI